MCVCVCLFKWPLSPWVTAAQVFEWTQRVDMTFKHSASPLDCLSVFVFVSDVSTLTPSFIRPLSTGSTAGREIEAAEYCNYQQKTQQSLSLSLQQGFVQGSVFPVCSHWFTVLNQHTRGEWPWLYLCSVSEVVQYLRTYRTVPSRDVRYYWQTDIVSPILA